MSNYNPRLLLPPEEELEVYPYRRVWRSITIEMAILFAVAAAFFALIAILGVRIPIRIQQPLNMLLAVLPVVLWLVFSLWRERFVPQPRERLLTVLIISGLAANAIAIPLIYEVLQPDRWLSLAGAINRILGYAFTVGIIQETVKYVVVYYAVWPRCFITRQHGIAYAAASAVGYAVVLNLHFVLTNTPPPDIAMLRIFDMTALNLAASIIVGYGLSEMRFGQPTPLLMMVMVALAAFINGVAIPVRAGLINASLALGISSTNPIRGLGFSAVLVLAVAFLVSFLINNADRRDTEAAASRED